MIEYPLAGEYPLAIDPVTGRSRSYLESLVEKSKERLDQIIPRNLLTVEGGLTIEKRVRVGAPAEEIARLAREEQADLIVMGTHGRKGLARVLMGSTAERILREAPCQVLVVKPKITVGVS